MEKQHVLVLDYLPNNSQLDSDFYSNNSIFQKFKEFRHDSIKQNIGKLDYLEQLKKLEKKKWSDRSMRRFVRKNPIPPQYLEDYTFVKRLAKLRWYFFEIFASDTMKNDRELMKELIREKQVFFRYASELLRSDRELIEMALDIGDCGNDIHKVWKKLSHSDCIHDGLVQLFRYPKRVLKYCTDEKLREDKELITATQFKSNRELVKQAVSYHGAILAYLDNKFKLDQEIALISLNTSPNRLWDVSPLVRNTLDFSINVADTQGSRWIFETYYKSQGEEFWSIAIQKRMLPSTLLPTNIYNDNNLMRIVLERDPSLLELCSDEIRDDFELVKIAVSHDIKNIRYASNRIRSSDETTSMLITLYPRIILYLEDNIKQNPKYYSLTGDLENMTVFKNAPYCIRNNANLSENFIKLDVGMFQYVSEELKNSRDFVWKIFSYNESILQYGSEELRNDFDFMSLCIEKNPLLFSHLSSNLRGNIEIIRLAIETAITNKVSAKQLRSNIIVHILAKDNEMTSLIDLYRMCSNNYENEKFLLLYFASPVLLFNEDFVLKEASKLTNDAWDFLKLFKRAVSEYEYIVAAAIILLDPTLYEHAYSFVCHSFPKDLAPSILYYLGEDHAPIVSDLFISKAIPVPLFGILSEYLRYYCASTLIAHKVPILEFVPNLMITTDNLCSLLPKYLSCEDKILVHILKYSNNIDFFKKIFEIYYSSQFTKLIKYASEGLRNDSNLMAQAIRCDPTNLQYASATLKSNRDLVALAVRLQPESFAYAAEELKNDFEYIKSISHSYNEVLLYNLATRNVRMNYLQKVRSKK